MEPPNQFTLEGFKRFLKLNSKTVYKMLDPQQCAGTAFLRKVVEDETFNTRIVVNHGSVKGESFDSPQWFKDMFTNLDDDQQERTGWKTSYTGKELLKFV